jgi:hypothetical protein
MAKKLTYRDDRNIAYTVDLEDIDSEGSIATNALFDSRINSAPNLPATIKMRYVNAFLKSNPRIKRRFYIGNLVARNSAIAGSEVLGLPLPSAGLPGKALRAWGISSYRGELRQF